MRELVRFFWNATRGHRLAPWRSPYLHWRMETYSGLKMDKIGYFGAHRPSISPSGSNPFGAEESSIFSNSRAAEKPGP
jgi:hypothetical protein